MKLDDIYDRLIGGGEFTCDDYELIARIYADEIPYNILNGDDGTVDEWFVEHYEYEENDAGDDKGNRARQANHSTNRTTIIER